MRIHYHGTLNNGDIFDSSKEGEPFEFVLGSNQVIPGFETAVAEMRVGETKEITLSPDQAYGERMEQLLLQVPKEQLPEQAELGMSFQIPLSNGQPHVFQLIEIKEDFAILDGNHPLSGQTLNFALELMAINPEAG